MKIEYDVYRVARFFGVDPALLQAVVTAEGDIVRVVRCSIPSVTMRETALYVTARSAVGAMCGWIKGGGEERQDDRRSVGGADHQIVGALQGAHEAAQAGDDRAGGEHVRRQPSGSRVYDQHHGDETDDGQEPHRLRRGALRSHALQGDRHVP